ncbi:MAG: membrane protein [Parcubacteria group bacterium Gr01-1014_48]|nr:MAG: membrane protein [Parcubacteria group bacterium Gr01-1014_48]
MEYILVILVLYIVVRTHSLSSRIDKLEERSTTVAVGEVRQQTAQPNTQSEFDDALHRAMFSPNEHTAATSPTTTVSTAGDRFVAWLKEDWIIKLGAFLLLIGFGWLTTYAFLNNWIGPMGRITLGVALGVCILVLGFWRIKKYLHQGGIFLVLGSTTILLTLFAAREIYEFFTPVSALAAMFITTAFVAYASVIYRSQTPSAFLRQKKGTSKPIS